MVSLRHFVLACCCAGLLATTSASAEPAYKSDDVVNFFEKATRGLTRGICVGTAQECDNNSSPPAPTFDMLVTFDVNSADLTGDAKTNLLEFAKALKDPRLKVARFAVEGHTDASGAEPYNMSLSVRRANSVVSFLVSQGVPPDRFDAKGFGETTPRVADPLDSVNRRVETRIILQ